MSVDVGGNGSASAAEPEVRKLDRVVIRFAGDSGDGMQLTGDRFTSEAAAYGNDLATLPNFPAEIRAPQGTLPGVSSFQLHFADYDILTPGDRPDVLVAMNPAALKANIKDLPPGGMLIVNTDEFTKRNLAKVGYETDPLDGRVAGVVPGAQGRDGDADAGRAGEHWAWARRTPSGRRTCSRSACCRGCTTGRRRAPSGSCGRSSAASPTSRRRTSWRSARAGTTARRRSRSRSRTRWRRRNSRRARTARSPATPPSRTGSSRRDSSSKLPILLGTYPITPASDILHELSKHKNFGITTFQAEDEIAGIGAALGASYGGALGMTTTSGPGIALKSETIGLAVMTELPLIVIDVQRGGPSTGLPTKTEQADLLQAMFGRNGEAPVPIVAPQSPADCFPTVLDAVRIALTYRTPVLLLSDGAIANGSEPWLVPDVRDLPDLSVPFADAPNGPDGTFWPYLRDRETLARPWAVPGTPGLQHRIGGLEKQDGTGNISYDPDNHDKMVRLRQAKIDGITVPDAVVDDPSGEATVLVVGWGSTYGPIGAAAGGSATRASTDRHGAPAPPESVARQPG